MAVTDQSSYAAFLASASSKPRYIKASVANTVAGQTFSLWRAAGFPDVGAIPTTAAAPTSATPGAWPFVAAILPETNNVGYLSAQMVNAGTVIVADRAQHMGGLSGTVTIAQTIGLTIPSGHGILADGSNAEWSLDCYADTGSTGVSATVTYVDWTDVTRTVTVAIPATMRAGRSIRFLHNAGQYIKSLTSVQHATTGTPGNYGFSLRRVIATCGVINPAIERELNSIDVGMARVVPDVCIEFLCLCSTTSTGIIQGTLSIGAK